MRSPHDPAHTNPDTNTYADTHACTGQQLLSGGPESLGGGAVAGMVSVS